MKSRSSTTRLLGTAARAGESTGAFPAVCVHRLNHLAEELERTPHWILNTALRE